MASNIITPRPRITSHAPKDYSCPFCSFLGSYYTGADDRNALLRASDVVAESQLSIAFLSIKWWPKNPGHALVVPKQHFESIYDMPHEYLADVAVLSQLVAVGMKRAYACEGISTRQHNEPAGQQDVWHYHQHVFPRWKDDNLYTSQDERLVTPEERLPYAVKLRGAIRLTLEMAAPGLAQNLPPIR